MNWDHFDEDGEFFLPNFFPLLPRKGSFVAWKGLLSISSFLIFSQREKKRERRFIFRKKGSKTNKKMSRFCYLSSFFLDAVKMSKTEKNFARNWQHQRMTKWGWEDALSLQHALYLMNSRKRMIIRLNATQIPQQIYL